ncbi:MAG: fatty acid desaturase family protein [Myxococcaceae bacterium]|nr:fatty acid desaturase family protein [Myxococcaceae bacterium]
MRRVTEVLTREEIAHLTEASDVRGAWSVVVTWSLITFAFALVWRWPNALTVAVALVVLGGRQLALAILMHEASHRSLFKTRWLNDGVGAWLCAAPVWLHLDEYREHHLRHHSFTGLDEDPDLGLVTPFPVSKASLVRKLARDLFGVTGLKRVVGLALMDLGYLTYTASVGARWTGRGRPLGEVLAFGVRRLGPVLLANGALVGVTVLIGAPWLSLLWLGAYLTTFSLFLRLRSLAEHACTERSADPLRNTRTTKANLLARLTVAPHHVNFHLEHHLLMTVPHHRLEALHRLLGERGVLADATLASGYVELLRLVSSSGPRPTA